MKRPTRQPRTGPVNHSNRSARWRKARGCGIGSRALLLTVFGIAVTTRALSAQPVATPTATPAVLPTPLAPAGIVDPAVGAANEMLDRGLAYLKSQQKPDGSWQNQHEPPGITALVLRSLVMNGKHTVGDDFVRQGYAALLTYQVDAGGIYRDLLANYNTAIAVSALSAAKNPDYDDEIAKAVGFLKGLQWTEQTKPEFEDPTKGQQVVRDSSDPFYGGWGYGGRSRGAGRPDLSNVQMTLDALNDAGVSKDDPAFQRALAFVTRTQNHSETNDQPWSGDDGGFAYGPSADRTGESFAGEYVGVDGRRMLRSYGSMTYAGLKSLIYAGLTRDDARVSAAWDWISQNWTLDENPGMRLNNPDTATYGLYYYYATLARTLRAYGEPVIVSPDGTRHDWRLELLSHLETLQQPDGSWIGDERWMEQSPVLVTAYVTQAIQDALADLAERPAAPATVQ